MATQRRSVWEIRFYALKQIINNEMERVKHDVFSAFLDGRQPKEELHKKYELYSELNKKATELTTKSASEIFLVRDY